MGKSCCNMAHIAARFGDIAVRFAVTAVRVGAIAVRFDESDDGNGVSAARFGTTAARNLENDAQKSPVALKATGLFSIFCAFVGQ